MVNVCQLLIDQCAMKNQVRVVACFVVLSFSFYSCMVPFGDHQTAKLVGKGNAEVEPFYSTYVWGASQAGLYMDYGLTDFMDVRASFSKFGDFKHNKDIVSIASFAPKIRLKKDVAALSLPVGMELDNHIVVTQPTLLLTSSVTPNIDLTFSPKAILTLQAPDDFSKEPLFAANIGLSIHIKGTPFTIRPEVGFGTEMRQFFNSGNWTYGGGLGLAFKIGR